MQLSTLMIICGNSCLMLNRAPELYGYGVNIAKENEKRKVNIRQVYKLIRDVINIQPRIQLRCYSIYLNE